MVTARTRVQRSDGSVARRQRLARPIGDRGKVPGIGAADPCESKIFPAGIRKAGRTLIRAADDIHRLLQAGTTSSGEQAHRTLLVDVRAKAAVISLHRSRPWIVVRWTGATVPRFRS